MHSGFFPSSSYPAHPRVCGEHSSQPISGQLVVGSSPRVRGTCWYMGLAIRSLRLIPACAGNILKRGPWALPYPAHPRVCGEHTSEAAISKLLCGSSPRVRGTFSALPVGQRQDRLIPACAGNMTIAPPRKLASTGSSPRVRGTCALIGRGRAQGRLIPACAGNIVCQRGLSRPTPAHPRVCGEHGPWALPL